MIALNLEGYSYHPSETYPCSLSEKNRDFLDNITRVESVLTDRDNIKVEEFFKEYEGTGAIQKYCTVTNTLEKDVTLSLVSSGWYRMPWEGKLNIYDPKKYRVHYALGGWQSECQWRSASFRELGLCDIGSIPTWRSFSVKSLGSWSTNKYYPIMMIEDMELNKTYYFEVESSTSWQIKIGFMMDDEHRHYFYVCMDAANVNNDGWYYKLKPGESYTTVPCVYGCVNGGVEEAVRELYNYKRAESLVGAGAVKPLVFNDYMGALWARPSDKKLIPLIDKAAELGVEYFCIDDGWHKAPDEDYNIKNGLGNGLWEPFDERFGDYTFREIIEYIISKGMKPGIWVELECFLSFVKNKDLDDDCYLRRNGEIIAATRSFLDVRKEKSQKYIKKVFSDLYGMGIRYVKNDYNHNIGIGCDSEKGSFSVGLKEQFDAFIKVMDEVREEYPDMIIENCASGSQRSDGNIMKHFSLVSTSDQMDYEKNPSIVAGTLAVLMPEKCGIWSYPYSIPTLLADESFDEFYGNKEYINDRLDGEETIFNFTTAILGVTYVSGHIDYMDEVNLKLYREGLDLYKEYREFTSCAYPIFPNGFITLNDKCFYSTGLINKEGTSILLSVWKINAAEDTYNFDLTKWVKNDSRIRQIYPADGYAVPFDLKEGILSVTMEKDYCGRVFRIDL